MASFKVFSLFLAGALATGAAFAQQSAPAPETQSPAPVVRTANPHRQAMRLGKQLNLTSDQIAKLEPILADRDQKTAAVKANTALSPMIAEQQLHAIQKNTRSQLSTVLTADQLQQLEQMQKSRAGKSQGQPLAPPAA